MVRDAYLGNNTHKDTLLCLFDQYNKNLKTLVEKQTTVGTYNKHVRTRNRLHQFLKKKRNAEDIYLKDISPEFIKDFERFMFVNCEYHRNTVMKRMQIFKTIVVLAHDNGWLSINPFAKYKVQFEATDRGYLSDEELMTLMEHKVECPYTEMARDVFVFCCFTGLSYIDVRMLREEHIKPSFDGELWIKIKRQKTNVQSEIPLLPIAQQILEKYKGKCDGGMLLPVPLNGAGNERLRELGKQCKFSVKVTFHLARHTFATTVTLGKGVPIETVSKMLGHRSVKTTQIYARVVNSKVSSDMVDLSQKLVILETVYKQKMAS
jgi:integrase